MILPSNFTNINKSLPKNLGYYKCIEPVIAEKFGDYIDSKRSTKR